MFKIVPNPTFTCDVPLSVPGEDKPERVRMTFKHKTRAELQAYQARAFDVAMQAGREAVLIEPWPYVGTTPTRSFDVAPDGSFIAVKPENSDAANPGESNPAVYRRLYAVSELQIVLNFAEELRVRQAAVAQ
jgi:hypothetical protein